MSTETARYEVGQRVDMVWEWKPRQWKPGTVTEVTVLPDGIGILYSVAADGETARDLKGNIITFGCRASYLRLPR